MISFLKMEKWTVNKKMLPTINLEIEEKLIEINKRIILCWKDLKCGQCSKYFKVKHNLSQHVKRIHEKLHMVQCEHCSRHFGCKSNLNEHKKIIHFRGQGF